VVRAVAVHLGAPHDLLRAQVERHHVGQAGTRHVQPAAVERGEGVVDVLVVPLAHEHVHPREVAAGGRVGCDLRQPLIQIGNDVDPGQPVVGVRVHHVGGALPVVAHHEHVAQAGARGARGRNRDKGQNEGQGGPEEGEVEP
jgi:hypothetical protein